MRWEVEVKIHLFLVRLRGDETILTNVDCKIHVIHFSRQFTRIPFQFPTIQIIAETLKCIRLVGIGDPYANHVVNERQQRRVRQPPGPRLASGLN